MKISSRSSNEIKHETLKSHKWICSSKICFETLKELEKTIITNENIWKWRKQLEKCNKCYLEMWNYSYLNTITRWEVSTGVHHFESKYKLK